MIPSGISRGSARRRIVGSRASRPRRADRVPWPLRMIEPAGNRPGVPSNSIATRCARSEGSGVSTANRGRIPQDPLAPERQECGHVTGLDGRGLEADGPRHRLVPDRVGEGQDGIEPQDRVEIELERDVG